MDITTLAQVWIERFIREGGLAIDATVGNGHDTVFLAEKVGPTGRVVGFDVQEKALEATRDRVEGEGCGGRVNLFCRSHVEMMAAVEELVEARRPCSIMFNLGYLPGGDKSVTTRLEGTKVAVATALDFLAPGGGMTVVLYPGHPEGRREYEAVLQWAETLAGPFEATVCRVVNRAKAPCLIAVEKRN